MSWGTITVGRLNLRERWEADASVDASTGALRLALTGQESCPPLTLAELRQRQEDILGMRDRFVPITFTDKTDLDGYYRVTDANAKPANYGGGLQATEWSLSATRVGPAGAVDIESRLTGVVRVNDFTLTGERWHAPAGSHYGYYTGSTQPSGSVSRASTDGAVTAYRGVPAGANPRWACTPASYGIGRARVVVDGYERSATNVALGSTWHLSNGLVKAEPTATNTLILSSYDGSAWEAKTWRVTVAGTTLTSFDAASIIRNDYELCTVRLLKSSAPGRVLLDLSIRRGSRVVECYLQSDVSATLGCRLATGEAATSSTSYVTATANDASGNKATCGCPLTFTADTTNCGLSKASVTQLPFYVGSVVNGSSAAAGDVASVLRDQYLVALAETAMGVRR